MKRVPSRGRTLVPRAMLLAVAFLVAAGFSSCKGSDANPAGTTAAGAGVRDAYEQSSVDPGFIASPSGEKAFAGAVGYGAATKGGQGGRVIAVTMLADSGAGSLRACIDAQGPRVCIFRVSGVIRFTTHPPIIHNPYITIAGQTAPGGGITLAHSGGAVGRTPLLIKNTHDVIVRQIRIRNDREGDERGSEDSITIEGSNNVIIDHVSASWARDELVNGFADVDFVTVSNSIFSWGIPKHDKCALLASDPVDAQHFSFINNVCAHNGDRNPDINFPPGSCVEVINNILYNAQSEFAEIWESYGGTPVSLVGNVIKAGPNTTPHAVGVVRQAPGSTGAASIYMADNRFVGDFEYVTPRAAEVKRASPPCPLTVKPMSADEAYDRVLATAGAWPRDALDDKAIGDVRNGTGHIMHEPSEIPDIAAGTPYPDADRDGMDDRWEAKNGADPKKFDAWAKAGGRSQANLDAFLDYLDQALVGRTGGT